MWRRSVAFSRDVQEDGCGSGAHQRGGLDHVPAPHSIVMHSRAAFGLHRTLLFCRRGPHLWSFTRACLRRGACNLLPTASWSVHVGLENVIRHRPGSPSWAGQHYVPQTCVTYGPAMSQFIRTCGCTVCSNARVRSPVNPPKCPRRTGTRPWISALEGVAAVVTRCRAVYVEYMRNGSLVVGYLGFFVGFVRLCAVSWGQVAQWRYVGRSVGR